MEPANVNPPPERDDALDAWLRQPATPLADAGFSTRVLAALPATTTVAHAPAGRTRRAVCLAGGAIIGSIVALAGFISGRGWTVSWAPVEATLAPLETQLLDPGVLLALAVATVSVFYAFWLGPRRRAAG